MERVVRFASMSLDEGSVIQISMDAVQGESDLYLQTSSQVGTQEFISNTRIFDADSNMINWEVNQQYAPRSSLFDS